MTDPAEPNTCFRCKQEGIYKKEILHNPYRLNMTYNKAIKDEDYCQDCLNFFNTNGEKKLYTEEYYENKAFTDAWDSRPGPDCGYPALAEKYEKEENEKLKEYCMKCKMNFKYEMYDLCIKCYDEKYKIGIEEKEKLKEIGPSTLNYEASTEEETKKDVCIRCITNNQLNDNHNLVKGERFCRKCLDTFWTNSEKEHYIQGYDLNKKLCKECHREFKEERGDYCTKCIEYYNNRVYPECGFKCEKSKKESNVIKILKTIKNPKKRMKVEVQIKFI